VSSKSHPSGPKERVSLFRQEAAQKAVGAFGKVLLVMPLAHTLWSIGLGGLAVVIGLFLYFGEYARHHTAPGMLVPDKGVIRIYPKSQGTVVKKFIAQGTSVRKGQILYWVSTEHTDLSEKSINAQQISLLEQQITLQKQKVSVLKSNQERYQQLLGNQIVSEEEYQTHRNAYLSASLDLNQLQATLTRERGASHYTVLSPTDGLVSASIAKPGERIYEHTLLASIVPEHSELQGVLLVPARAIGFVRPGSNVLLKYAAYPYQQFGLYESTVIDVDKSILDPREASFPIEIKEAFYRITVRLAEQTVNVYGKPHSLTAGMLFDGVILGEKRRIWQWIMEPIFSLRGVF
jgi:membrane fusion protein